MKLMEGVFWYHYPISGLSSNVYLIDQGSEYWVIDTGIAKFGVFNHLIRAIKNDGLNLAKISRIFFTHGHPDHINALPNFLNFTNAEPWIHNDDVSLGVSGESSFWQAQLEGCIGLEYQLLPVPIPWFQWFVRNYLGKFPQVSSIKYTPIKEIVGDRLTMQVIHTPGHTPGHCSFYFPQTRLMICGDILSQIPGKPVLNTATADYDQYEHSLESLSDLDVMTFAKGHGPKIFHSAEDFHNLCTVTLINLRAAKAQVMKFLTRHTTITIADCKGLFDFRLWRRFEQPFVGLAVIKSLLAHQQVDQIGERFTLR
jgi:glyoxylase-like metal-dependent hydrolase (beta-lactamase superfamily II)